MVYEFLVLVRIFDLIKILLDALRHFLEAVRGQSVLLDLSYVLLNYHVDELRVENLVVNFLREALQSLICGIGVSSKFRFLVKLEFEHVESYSPINSHR